MFSGNTKIREGDREKREGYGGVELTPILHCSSFTTV
jgi:hypothetical protein